MTNDERESLINAAVERVLLRLPDVVGNLIMNHAEQNKINREFYKKYPDFKDHKDVVCAVIEQIEGKNPSIAYSEIIDNAVPEIRRQIKTKTSLSMTPVSKPNLDFSSKSFIADSSFGNGEI